MPLTYFEKTTETRSVAEALRHDGAVVVTDIAEPGLVDTIMEELRPRLEKSGLDTRGDFNGDRTLRVEARVLCTAPSAADLVDHDLVVRVADEILLPHCAAYQVGSMSAIELLPGTVCSGIAPGRFPLPDPERRDGASDRGHVGV